MKNHRILFILFGVLALASLTRVLNAQDTTKPEPCPEVTVFGPTVELKQKETGDYSVVVDSKGVYREITFEWSAVGGKLVEGQGATRVKVKRTADDFFVSLRIHGLRPRCENDYQEKKPDLTPPEAIMLNRITETLDSSNEDKVKQFVDATRAERKQVFWVIFGFKKSDGAGGVANRRQLLLDLFEKNGRIGHDARLTFIDIEADEDFIEFWKTTANARPPILDK